MDPSSKLAMYTHCVAPSLNFVMAAMFSEGTYDAWNVCNCQGCVILLSGPSKARGQIQEMVEELRATHRRKGREGWRDTNPW